MRNTDKKNTIEYTKSRKDDLEETKKRLVSKLNRVKTIRYIYFFIGIMCIIVAIFMYIFLQISNILVIITLIYGFIFILVPLIHSNKNDTETQIQQIDNEIDLLTFGETTNEIRAEKLFKYHQFEVKKYYDQTLNHSSWIFFTGLFCIIIGFIFAGTIIYLVFNSQGQSLEFNEKILISSVGLISTLLANFIGTIYLNMYSKTIKSLTEFHNRLVSTHHLHFVNFLTSKIENQDLREKTLSDLTKKIVEK